MKFTDFGNRRLHALVAALVLAAITLGTSATRASTIAYQLTSTCGLSCANVGLGAGDLVTSTIDVDMGAVAPGALIGHGDILSFAFDFGSVQIDSASALGFYFSGMVAADLSEISIFFIGVSEDLDYTSAGTGGDTIALPASAMGRGWLASTDGGCMNADCSLVSSMNAAFGTSGVDVAFTRVPEPATALLLGLGIAGIAGVRRETR